VSGARALLVAAALALAACKNGWAPPVPSRVPRPPLRIACSDWPGWTAFEIGVEKGWFDQAGVAVTFTWLEYLPSMDAFSAGKVDAVAVTNGDALVTGATGAKSRIILVTDYSNGNDQIIARPGITRFADLKGKKVGLELTLVEHLMFTKALEKFGVAAADVQLVNVPTNETPAALAAGELSAVAAWYPVADKARQAVPGATVVFSSADLPGLIYDTLAVTPTSLEARREDWARVVKVWYRIADFVRDPRTQREAVAIMAAKVGVRPEDYATHLSGTYFLSLAEARARFQKKQGLDSLYGSSRIADQFNVTHKAYPAPEAVDEYIFPDLVMGM
jgi:NitT/TauT family transport system substrate-binding protein